MPDTPTADANQNGQETVPPSDTRATISDRLAAAADRSAPPLIVEFLEYVRQNKKWWLIPIVAALLIVALLLLVGSSPLAPFIYPLF